ncbi:MAG: Fur family transcriptional regulator [Tissierellia bacterium]|nr:Fur family transcriptional regulator [Tissierellia bacterium]
MEELIRSKNLKLTKGRLEVLKLMYDSEVPMSADEVYAKIPRTICSSLSTVYRVLNQLTEKGLLQSSLKQNGITYYEKASDEHRHYITCSSCGKIVPLENCPMDAIDNYIRKDTGYEITGHIFELTGICPDCKE